MTQVQQTSLLAYREIAPSLGKRQRQVLKVLQADPNRDFTNYELAFILGWPVNCVTGRTNELRKKGLVVLAGKRRQRETGKLAMAWRAL